MAIIIVSGKGDLIDRVVGLEVGADDYITKLFHVREVIARVQSVLRRAKVGGVTRHSENIDGNGAAVICFDGLKARPDRF